jgi:8-oxo-dGTP pyrophosphatase MutT (NUDIX family)
MPISNYLRGLRCKLGHDLVLAPAVTGLVFDDAGRMLLVRHVEGGVWVAPGGAVDPDERPVDALVREVWEETGLVVEPTALAGVFGGPEFRVRYANGDEVAYVMAVYECRATAGQLRPDGVETLETRWVAAHEVAALELPPWARVVLPDALASRGRPRAWTVTWRPPVE